MLVQFMVKNFMSFREEAVFSMLATKLKSQDKELDARSSFETEFDIKLLKSAVIYGANASGKSNLFKGMRFMRECVINSSKESQADERIDVVPFLLNDISRSQPSEFLVIFIQGGNMYEYAFSADSEKIVSESLKVKKPSTATKTLFERKGDQIVVKSGFREGAGLEKRTRSNALFISVCANFDGQISAEVIAWFRRLKIVSGVADVGLMNYTQQKLKDESSNKKIVRMLDAFDTGFTGLKVSDGGNDLPAELKRIQAAVSKGSISSIKFSLGGQVFTEHNVYDNKGKIVGTVDFDLAEAESEGTKKLVALAGPLLDVLENSYIMFLDELDARLHPALSLEIFNMFNCDTKNRKSAQLIAATHSTNLLSKDFLRRDQVWFASKNTPGESRVRSLVEYKIRNDASYEKEYLQGKFEGVPLVGNLDGIFN